MTVLNNGSISTMESDDNLLRTKLAIEPSALPVELSYRSRGTCLYDESIAPSSGPSAERQVNIVTRPLKNRIYLLFDGADGKKSGYLIDNTGKLYSFNTQLTTSPGSANSETYERFSQELLAKAQSNKPVFSGEAHVLNEFTVEFPEYLQKPLIPGDVAAYVKSEGGAGWGQYRYVGVTNYRGIRAAVFDLTRDQPSGSTLHPLLVGFTVVDIQTAMPLYVGFKAGGAIHLKQISCN